MVLAILQLLAGFVLIVLGGNYVTDGSVAVAKKFRVPTMIVGLTVVAFGSSTPDLVISVMSTLQGKSELAVGDIVGAGIFDMLLVIGVTAMIRPIKLSRQALTLDLPVMVLAGVIIFVCAGDQIMGHHTDNVLDRVDGIVMLLIFIMFMFYTVNNTHKAVEPGAQGAQPQSSDTYRDKKPMAIWLAAVCIVGGLGALVLGGNWIVDGATVVARRAGWSEALIGLTIVAIGSSVPDLASSVVAAAKGQTGLAVGNVLGSCIMDMLFVLGTCATIHPLNAGKVTMVDFATVAGAAMLVWILSLVSRKREIGRGAGVVLILGYIAYVVYLVLMSR